MKKRAKMKRNQKLITDKEREREKKIGLNFVEQMNRLIITIIFMAVAVFVTETT